MSDIDQYREGYERGLKMKHEFEEKNIVEVVLNSLSYTADAVDRELTLTDEAKRGYKDGVEGKDFNAPEGESNSGGCFVSTACCEAMGLSDDCEELQTLRHFRDTYLLASREGEKEVAAYYAHSPRVLKKIRSEANSRETLRRIYHELVVPTVKMIHRKEYAAAHTHYRTFVRDLCSDSEE